MTTEQYNECVTLYADNVFRFIVKNIRHYEDAKDIVQSAFEKLWRTRETVEFSKSKSLLFTIAYNQMIDCLRKTRRIELRESFSEDENKTDYQHHSSTKKNLMEALNKLNEVQRSLVLLKDYEGYNYEEIGEIMGLNASQVKVYLHRARLTLRDYLVSPQNV